MKKHFIMYFVTFLSYSNLCAWWISKDNIFKNRENTTPVSADLSEKDRNICNARIAFWEQFLKEPEERTQLSHPCDNYAILYHIINAFSCNPSDLKTIESIKQHGLLSANELEKQTGLKTPRKFIDGLAIKLGLLAPRPHDEFDNVFFATKDGYQTLKGLCNEYKTIRKIVRKNNHKVRNCIVRLGFFPQDENIYDHIPLTHYKYGQIQGPEILFSTTVPPEKLIIYELSPKEKEELLQQAIIDSGQLKIEKQDRIRLIVDSFFYGLSPNLKRFDIALKAINQLPINEPDKLTIPSADNELIDFIRRLESDNKEYADIIHR